jgi:hypothetical protein
MRTLTLMLAGVLVGAGGMYGAAAAIGEDGQAVTDRCLAAAIRAYPSDITPDVATLDETPQCEDLTDAQRDDLRRLMSVFVRTAVEAAAAESR